jgi:hypothetical protein
MVFLAKLGLVACEDLVWYWDPNMNNGRGGEFAMYIHIEVGSI